jgi:hypothetical protein
MKPRTAIAAERCCSARAQTGPARADDQNVIVGASNPICKGFEFGEVAIVVGNRQSRQPARGDPGGEIVRRRPGPIHIGLGDGRFATTVQMLPI